MEIDDMNWFFMCLDHFPATPGALGDGVDTTWLLLVRICGDGTGITVEKEVFTS